MFSSYICFLESLFQPLNFSEYYLLLVFRGTTFLSLVAGSITFYFVSWLIIKRCINAFAKRSENDYDDILIKNKVISRTSYLLPAYIINRLVAYTLPSFPNVSIFIKDTIEVYVILMVIFILIAIINSFFEIYNTFERSRTKSIKGVVQVVKIVVYIVGSLMVIAAILDTNLSTLFLGLGTLSAVLMLVFKDAILGFVGGLQLSLNDMVRLGDWISMPKFGADGDVLDITLTTVKVQNFDKTITTIPTYALVSDYFTNYRGMSESGGRRIKRNISIDMESVKFCSDDLFDELKKLKLLSEFVKLHKVKTKSIDSLNDNLIDLTNSKRFTNLELFRDYVSSYLNNHPNIHNEMPVIVRQLQSTDKGLPIEIYVFSNQLDWKVYEDLQSEIIDHIIAILPLFKLRVFQATTSYKQGIL